MQLPTCEPVNPRLSFDGYVRLTFDALAWLAFRRRQAWEDAGLVREFLADDLPAMRAGYCEWETEGDTVVAVGWTWFEIASGGIFLAPGDINSNLMLVSPKHYDLGVPRTGKLLRAWLSGVKWQPEFVRPSF